MKPQISQYCAGYIDEPACDEARKDVMKRDPDVLRKLSFIAAGSIWLETRRAYLRPRPFYGYQQHVKHLGVFFGDTPLYKIHIGHIREYQKARTHNKIFNFDGTVKVNEPWPHRAGPSIINHETSALQQILRRAGEWTKIEEHFEPLPMPRWHPPKVMSDEEEMRLFAIASTNPSWSLAFWVAALSVNTGASGIELRHLRWMNVKLDVRVPIILIDAETAKEEERGRVVVLNETAQNAIRQCLNRAMQLGSFLPEHYVFPFRICPGRWDPCKPTTDSWLRRSFGELRIAAGMTWLTPHCFRHQHITLSFEAKEPEQTIRLRVGHVSDRMTRWYSSLRRETQKTAVDAIDPTRRFGPQSVKIAWLQQIAK